jgi:hypothetical protein
MGAIESLSKEPSKTFRATVISSSVARRDGWKIFKPAKSCLCTSAEISDVWAIMSRHQGETMKCKMWGRTGSIYQSNCGDGLEAEPFEKTSFKVRGRRTQQGYHIEGLYQGWSNLQNLAGASAAENDI